MLLALAMTATMRAPDDRPGASAVRLPQNPLITVKTSPSLGDNVNGPAIVRMPAWVKNPLGRYYAYFAHHKGRLIRLAFADAIAGPWKVYEPGVLRVEDTAFMRPPPDPPDDLTFYTHVASPEISIDDDQQRIVMWFHGWWTDGKPWPVDRESIAAWTRRNGYAQFTQGGVSADGIHFDVQPAITKVSYLRAFRVDGVLYSMSRLGQLARSRDPVASFEVGPNPFRDGPYAGRVRHVALLRRGRTLFVFFSGIGDAPERILLTTIALAGDWQTWKASSPVEVLRPETSYECPDLPNLPSTPGEIYGPAQQMRDPAVYEENGTLYLFYTVCGEQGIAAAEVTLRGA